MSFPGLENSLSIPAFQVYPGLWPPWRKPSAVLTVET